jgi:hypothetical protein
MVNEPPGVGILIVEIGSDGEHDVMLKIDRFGF